MAQQTFTEEIVSLVKTKFRQVAKYVSPYTYLDFLDDDIPNVRSVKQLIDIAVSGAVVDDLRIKFTAGVDSTPGLIDMSAYNGSYGQLPIVQTVIKNPTPYAWYSFQPGYDVDPDDPDSILQSITIFGNDDGTGKFAEDTWVTVKASLI